MSCNTQRRKLWKLLSLDTSEVEAIFLDAKKSAQGRAIKPEDRAQWIEKTYRLLALFDYYGIPRPVHSQKSDLPRLSSLAGYAALWDWLADKTLPDVTALEEPRGINRRDITSALTQLGQAALERGLQVEMVTVGGAAMILAYSARVATHDVDVVILQPKEARIVREISRSIAEERGWPEDWLNDGAKGYMRGLSEGRVVFTAPGIQVRIPNPVQLLAMKLAAWRTKKDEADARRLLRDITPAGSREQLWLQIEPFLVPGIELKAKYAFLELWEELYGDH